MNILIATLFLFFSLASYSQAEPQIQPQPKSDYVSPCSRSLFKVGSDSCEIYVPKIPNEMSSVFCISNIWRIITDCEFDEYHLGLFNRWGELIWETEKQDDYFDIFDTDYQYGIPEGTYVWWMKGKINGTEEFDLKGCLTILK